MRYDAMRYTLSKTVSTEEVLLFVLEVGRVESFDSISIRKGQSSQRPARLACVFEWPHDSTPSWYARRRFGRETRNLQTNWR
jgi:hypothetical protein